LDEEASVVVLAVAAPVKCTVTPALAAPPTAPEMRWVSEWQPSVAPKSRSTTSHSAGFEHRCTL